MRWWLEEAVVERMVDGATERLDLNHGVGQIARHLQKYGILILYSGKHVMYVRQSRRCSMTWRYHCCPRWHGGMTTRIHFRNLADLKVSVRSFASGDYFWDSTIRK